MSLMKYVTYVQLKRLESSAKVHSRWTLLYNCAAFATNVWNETIGDNLSVKGPWASPRSLAYNMQQREGYEIASPMRSRWP